MGYFAYKSQKKAQKKQTQAINELIQKEQQIFNLKEQEFEKDALKTLERNKTVQASTGFEMSDFDRGNQEVITKINTNKELRALEQQAKESSLRANIPTSPSLAGALFDTAINIATLGTASGVF